MLPAAFGLAIFLSAVLLFSVQPLMGKLLLPLLGGTPAVWNTCMLFFQAVLLCGYAYALLVSRWPLKRQPDKPCTNRSTGRSTPATKTLGSRSAPSCRDASDTPRLCQ